jgi:rhamnose utilization protein RhaD (predicted bifunctional aldolase and dehydrogenase)/NAD(P)-dependent dehydrogenase (short-subunit alcohol dehydrogenase family)
MQNRWSPDDIQSLKAEYPDVSEDLLLRVYTSRLIGSEPTLVMHGGGNTSVKTTACNGLGEEIEVIAVKGSGWDLSTIQPPGFPCVDLDHCRRLRALSALSDEQMVNELRTHLLDYTSPNPSVETLLHAFLPHKFVDHSHADAILTLVDQARAVEICKEIFGDRLGVVEYIMPGFQLARRAAEVYEENPEVEGLLLLKHGLFTFGATAEESYKRHIEMVTLAEEYLGRHTRLMLSLSQQSPSVSYTTLAPVLRGLLEERTGHSWLLDWRPTETTRAFSNSPRVLDWSQRGPITPDHVIRTKPAPLVLAGLSPEEIRSQLSAALDHYEAEYKAYFERNNARVGGHKQMLDPLPRVFLVEGLGLVTAGATAKAASVAADLYEHTIDVIMDAMSVGEYEPVGEADIFDMEYWSLEQAKLGKKKPALLAGKVTFVTGAASGIGKACAEVFARKGSALALLDADRKALEPVVHALRAKGTKVLAKVVDVTDEAAVLAFVQDTVEHFGGVDVVISNAGSAFQAPIAECSSELLRESFELNFFSHQSVASTAVKVMQAQGTGGVLLFNASKAAFNPGAGFGPYALPKAAVIALMKQYAVEYGKDGIRSNAINADRIRTGLFTDDFVKERAAARGLEPEAYFRSNLLQAEVTAEQVAHAFLDLTLATRTTGATLTVDGGNIAASPR